METLKNCNEILRSAHAIAQRKGKHTNWAAFENIVKIELLRQSGAADGVIDEQVILRSTVTPKTFRLQPQDSEDMKLACHLCGKWEGLEPHYDVFDQDGMTIIGSVWCKTCWEDRE